MWKAYFTYLKDYYWNGLPTFGDWFNLAIAAYIKSFLLGFGI